MRSGAETPAEKCKLKSTVLSNEAENGNCSEEFDCVGNLCVYCKLRVEAMGSNAAEE